MKPSPQKKGRLESKNRLGPVGWNLWSWGRGKPKQGSSEDKARCADQYSGYLALKLAHGGVAWFTARGYSMLSVFAPMERVRVVPVPDAITPGQVVVFCQGAKLTAHRVVGQCTEKGLWHTKGDTLARFDKPIGHGDIIGAVSAVQGWRGKRILVPDADAARLSANLARKLCGPRNKYPGPIKMILYVITFLALFPFRRRPFILKMVAISEKAINGR